MPNPNKDFQHYDSNVLGGGDGTSHATKKTVDQANSETSGAVSGLLTGSPGEIKLGEYILSLGTDGVGTKLQIYMRQFENYFQEYNSSNKDEVNYAIIKEKTLELCERMIADLTAMLFDDGINGERVIAFTDIIDTNTTDGPRAKIFFEAFKEALGKSIINNDALLLNGETANLGENGKFLRAIERYRNTKKIMNNEILRIKEEVKRQEKQISLAQGNQKLIDSIQEGIESNKKGIGNILAEIRSAQQDMIALYRELELNLAGTFLGVKSADEGAKKLVETDTHIYCGAPVVMTNELKSCKKLVEMEAGDIIIALSETKTEKGIISPRSNGITLIRKSMKKILGDNWENKTFEDYLSAIGEKASEVPETLRAKLAGLKMWDIATGKTTVFNKFIADELLGGQEGNPITKISGLRHGTGNPLFKLFSGLKGRKDLMFDVDISKLDIPDIFILLQIALGIDDKEAAKPWNMGLPFTIVCKPGEEEKILAQAKKSGITANVVGEVKKRKKGDSAIVLKGVGIGKSTITYSEEEK